MNPVERMFVVLRPRSNRMRNPASLLIAAALATACVSACAPPPAVRNAVSDDRVPTGFPADAYRRASERGEPVFSIDPARSRVVIDVRRGGTLARAGHDHVVASHDVHGMVAPSDARADLYIRLEQLVVDELDVRAESGFDAGIPEAAIAATRTNMLSRVLHADAYPFALISVAGVEANRNLSATITVNGVSRSARIPVEIQMNGEELSVSGALALDQTEFGITPLSLFNGAIEVQNRVDIRFSIYAHRVTAASPH
jgi:polyisoprenoid-binding protein YceI